MNKCVFKIGILFLIMLVSSIDVFAQEIHIPTDFQGRRFTTKNYVALKGSPYLFNEWAKGSVKFMKGTTFEGMIKYDQIEDNIVFSSPQNEPQAFAEQVFEFTIEDPSNNAAQKLFRKGFGTSPLDNQNSNLFFEILVEGNTYLLKRTSKDIVEQTLYNSATKEQHVKELTSYYISNNTTLTKFKKNEKQLLTILNDKAPELQKYIKENKLDVKHDDDLKKVIIYYNSIK